MLEFPSWELAKPWSYISGYAVVDALRNAGHDVELVVLLHGSDDETLARVIGAFNDRGARFDCAFFWLPHLEYGERFWRVADRLAPKRVGVLIESLRYTADEVSQLKHLARRRKQVLRSLAHCTHVITLDPADFRELESEGHRAFWVAGIVPTVPDSTFVAFEEKSTRLLSAGTIYAGQRQFMHERLVAHGVLDPTERLQHSPELIAEFETAVAEVKRRAIGAAAAAVDTLLFERVRTARLALWHEYLRYLSRFAAVISLPAYFKGFPGRVFEGIMAGCAVFIFEVCDFERQKRVFRPGEHVYYLPAEPTDADIALLVAVANDPGRRRALAEAARQQAYANCDATIVMRRVMDWVSANDKASALGLFAGRAVRRLLVFARRNRRIDEAPSYDAC
jgi:glycosyltransferase involved in cell wall biosynthesis